MKTFLFIKFTGLPACLPPASCCLYFITKVNLREEALKLVEILKSRKSFLCLTVKITKNFAAKISKSIFTNIDYFSASSSSLFSLSISISILKGR